MNRAYTLKISLVLNAVFLFAAIMMASKYMLLWMHTDRDVGTWADYAGVIQAQIDYGNGLRRLYRPALVVDESRSHYTGELNDGAEVWEWDYRPESGEAGKAGADAYTDGYDRTMRQFIKDPASFPKFKPPAATQTQATRDQ